MCVGVHDGECPREAWALQGRGGTKAGLLASVLYVRVLLIPLSSALTMLVEPRVSEPSPHDTSFTDACIYL